MEDRRVLIAEDDPISGKLLVEVASSVGFQPVLAQNGRLALDLFKKNPFPVVITDIQMPEMDGSALIDHLKDIEFEPVIIVQTVIKESEHVIEIMRRGVYDYVIKPIDVGEFVLKLERAYETSRLRRMKRIVDKEKVIRLERELDWYKWYDSAKNRELTKLDRSLFHSLHTSFNQGAGFGALLTLLDIVSQSARRENNHYIIEAGLMDLVNENVALSGKVLRTFSEIDWLLTHDLELARMEYGALYDMVADVRSEMERYAALKGQSLVMSERKAGLSGTGMMASAERLRTLLAELIVNACKFSEPNTPVFIIVDAVHDAMQVSVISKPVPDEQGRAGIPLGYENIVFEPFFRMTRTVFEGYDTLDYGLGLTLADKIARKHGGRISAANIVDYSDLSREPMTKVNVTVSVPLITT